MEYTKYSCLLVVVLLTSTSQLLANPMHQKSTDQYDEEIMDFLMSKDDDRGTWRKREAAKVKIEALGCFADNLPRALSQLYFNARENNVLDWNAWPNMNHVINACASHAVAEGFQVFGVQHYGECWGQPGDVRSSTYDTYGPSDKCVQGVGGEWTNYVYRILPQASAKCNINGQEYQEGEIMEILNTTDFFENTMCQECTCQGGLPSNCRQLYHCHLSNKNCEKYIMAKDDCCPVCGCYNNGRKVPEGHRWNNWLNDEECRECICKNGQGICTTRKHWCPSCDYAVVIEGRCCPLCVPGIPTTQPWFTIPITTEPPELTLPPPPPVFPPKIKRMLIDRSMEPPEIKRMLIDRLMEPPEVKRRRLIDWLVKRLKMRRKPKTNLR